MSQASPLAHSVSQKFVKVSCKLIPLNSLSDSGGSATGRYLTVKGIVSAAHVDVIAKPTEIAFDGAKARLEAQISVQKEEKTVMSRTFEETFYFRELKGENMMAILEALDSGGRGRTHSFDHYVPSHQWIDGPKELRYLLENWWKLFNGPDSASGSVKPAPNPTRGRSLLADDWVDAFVRSHLFKVPTYLIGIDPV